MKNDLWIAVHDTFKALAEVFPDTEEPDQTASNDTEAPAEDKGAPQTADSPPVAQVVQARSRIRNRLELLRETFSRQLSERDCYLALFPIVAHFDELVQTRYLKTDHRSWPPLQSELFQIGDAGEVFYDTLDDLMLKPQTLPFVYEVFYLCLNDGFVGRYARNPVRIHEYQERLRARIPVADVTAYEGPAQETPRLEAFRSPLWYYAAVGGILIAFFFILMAMARVWDPLV